MDLMRKTRGRRGTFNERQVGFYLLWLVLIETFEASKVFTRKIFKTKVHDTFIQNTERLCGVIDRHVEDKTIVDFQKTFFRFTLDTIGEIGFGVDLNTIEAGQVPFASAFDTVQNLIPFRMFRPSFGPFDQVFQSERAMSKNMKILDDFSAKIISERRANVS